MNPHQSTTHSVPTATVLQRVRAFLHLRSEHLSRQIDVREEGGAIVLEGVVGRFHHRQVVVTCALHVAGVRTVIDRIVVREPAAVASDS